MTDLYRLARDTKVAHVLRTTEDRLRALMSRSSEDVAGEVAALCEKANAALVRLENGRP